MKRILLAASVSLALFSLPSCKDDTGTDAPQITKLTDTLLKAYATVGSVKVQVEDRTQINVVLGDAHLYAASEADKAKTAKEVGQLAVSIFGKDTYLQKGKLIVTKNERNTLLTPPDGQSTPIDIKAIKEAMPK
jgi:hypothetical protein